MAGLSERQRDILIRTALGEARGEGVDGMADVIQVIMNRAGSGRYPSDPAKVALQPNQFSTWNKGAGGNNPQQFRKGSAEYRRAEQALDAVLSGSRPDYTGGALFYHTPAVSPSWAPQVNTNGTIQRNGHVFYPSHPVPPGEIPNTVATALDVAPPRIAPQPTPMPAMIGAMRNLQPASTNVASLYAGIYPPPAPITDRDLILDRGISDTVELTQAMQSPSLAAALAANIAASQRPQLSSGPISYAGQDRGPRSVANVPLPRARPSMGSDPGGGDGPVVSRLLPTLPSPARDTAPRMTPAQIRADNGQVLSSRAAPSRSAPPMPVGVPQSYARQDAIAPAARSAFGADPGTRADGPVVSTVPSVVSNVGQPPVTRAVQSVPVSLPKAPAAPAKKAPLTIGAPPSYAAMEAVKPSVMDDIGTMPTFDDFAAALAPRVPAANNSIVANKDQSRLLPNPIPAVPPLREVGVATALDVAPPVLPPLPIPRPQTVAPRLPAIRVAPTPRPRPLPAPAGHPSLGGFLMSALMPSLARSNIGAAPTMVAGQQPGGTLATAVSMNGMAPVTLMRSSNAPSQAFDAAHHSNQNMDVYRANRAAIDGPINKSSIDKALREGKTLVK